MWRESARGVVIRAAAAAGVLIGALALCSVQTARSAQSSIGTVALDMDTAGNSATGLGTLESCAELSSKTDTGKITSYDSQAGVTLSVTDGSKAYAPDEWAGYRLRITSGSLAGQISTIAGNSATTLDLRSGIIGTPKSGDGFEIVDFLPVDVVLDQLPAQKAMTGFQFKLSFDTGLVRIAAVNDSFLLEASGSTTVVIVNKTADPPMEDSVPFEASPWLHAAVDTGPAESDLEGVLARFDLEPAASLSASGFSPLLLSDVIVADDSTPSQAIPVNLIQDATVAVDEGCASAPTGPSATATAEAVARSTSPAPSGDGASQGDGTQATEAADGAQSGFPAGGTEPGSGGQDAEGAGATSQDGQAKEDGGVSPLVPGVGAGIVVLILAAASLVLFMRRRATR
jgi:hypothetical protein